MVLKASRGPSYVTKIGEELYSIRLRMQRYLLVNQPFYFPVQLHAKERTEV